MKTIETLDELLVKYLRSLYDAEILISKSLPKMRTKTNSKELKELLNLYIERIESKISKLDQIFMLLEENSVGVENKVIDGIMNSSKKLLNTIIRKDVRDAAIVSELQRINHLLITDYGTSCAFAKTLKLNQVAKLLQQIVEEEKQTDKLFSELAEKRINVKAKEVAIV
jgi:ferritin-like metal-binding protein YciE